MSKICDRCKHKKDEENFRVLTSGKVLKTCKECCERKKRNEVKCKSKEDKMEDEIFKKIEELIQSNKLMMESMSSMERRLGAKMISIEEDIAEMKKLINGKTSKKLKKAKAKKSWESSRKSSDDFDDFSEFSD